MPGVVALNAGDVEIDIVGWTSILLAASTLKLPTRFTATEQVIREASARPSDKCYGH